MDGLNASELFKGRYSYSYDDLILLPAYIDFTLNDINLETSLTSNIKLKIPFISSPMDTVTESEMAIKMALLGGLGIIHCNNTITKQVTEVKKVKRYNNGFITNPIIFRPDNTIADLLHTKERLNFSGFPITENGEIGSKLLGLVCNRDMDYIEDHSIKLEDIMSKDLITGTEDMTFSEASKTIIESKQSRLPIVNNKYELVSLVCRKDIINNKMYPNASKNKATEQLLVGASISTNIGYESRLDALVSADIDVVVIDSSQGNSIYQIETIQYIKEKYPNLDIIAGNVVTNEQAANLIHAGADALRVGMGIGSICTTQEVCGVGRGQASAVYNVAQYSNSINTSIGNSIGNITSKWSVPIIADGGISNTGHIIKALALGASCVMMGSLLAGTDESPGDYYYKDDIRVKKYRGMGSLESMKGKCDRYYNSKCNKGNVNVAQGVSGEVIAKGSLETHIAHLLKGTKHGFQNIGSCSIEKVHLNVSRGRIRFEIRTLQSQNDGKVHHLYSFEQ